MTNDIEQAITETLQAIKNYIDVAILNNHETQSSNNKTIVELRAKYRLSVARVAIELNQTAEYVNQLENGLRKMTVNDAVILASLYGVSADSLI
jgi:DNA-binding transcriptional regulator YiaG